MAIVVAVTLFLVMTMGSVAIATTQDEGENGDLVNSLRTKIFIEFNQLNQVVG